jgi:hypothetical protein
MKLYILSRRCAVFCSVLLIQLIYILSDRKMNLFKTVTMFLGHANLDFSKLRYFLNVC